MNPQRSCPDCGSPLPPDAPEGICPECLMKGGLEFSRDTAPSIEPIGTAEERNLPNPGDQFGEYRIIRELGRGGMGAAYEAEQLETGRRVALKVLTYRLNSAEARARFFREGRLAASINHPNSVYVFGTGEIEAIREVGQNLYSIAGNLAVREFNRFFEEKIPESPDYTSIAGFIEALTGRIPLEGESVRYQNLVLTIERIDGFRIVSVRIRTSKTRNSGVRT